MDDLLWIDAQKFVDLAITFTAVVAAGLIAVQALYLLLLAIVFGRTKRPMEEQ